MKEHFLNKGFEIDGLLHLTGRQALECFDDGAFLLDVREEFEIVLKDFGVKGKLWCPFSEFDQMIRSLPVDCRLIVADCVGLHSKEAARKLLQNGFGKIANLAGGIAEWEKDGLPMKKDQETMGGQCPCMIRSRPQQN